MIQKTSLLIFLLLFTSCSFLKNHFYIEDPFYAELKKYERMSDSDYVSHLAFMGETYKQSQKKQIFDLTKQCNSYLEKLYWKIVRNNELLFTRDQQPTFFLIKDDSPFIFSLPPGNIYISSGLLSKYIRYENILVAPIAFEMIRLHRYLYPRKEIVPVGFLSTQRLLYLTRISGDIRQEMNRWVYYAMKRADFDGFSYLAWLQIQNKNSLDFTLHLGDVRSISHEEYSFKNFIVKEGVFDKDTSKYESNSSQQFYQFVGCTQQWLK